jgi:prepilin-type N-terminal cleavage/methylation domain-containing protein
MNDEQGFSLVEVLVSVALMAIAMISIAPLFLGALRTNAVGWDYSVLNALAKSKLEEVLQYNFNDPRLSVPTNSTIALDGVSFIGQLYLTETPTTQTVSGYTTSYPYELIYMVSDYKLADLPSGSTTDPAKATYDGSGGWNPQSDLKYITVICASQRSFLERSPYSVATGLSVSASGKQIRMSAIKSP